jgi:methionine synthase II (cobalamin-independent)
VTHPVTRPWPRGAATGIGSLPGTDPVEAASLVFGELPGFAHVPELPARGAGADMIGRTAALLVDLPVEIVASGWRLAAHRGRDLRRAADFLAWDLDAVQVQAAGYAGALKVQAAGPWTLAANIELPNGHTVLRDPGAVRDLADSLAEGLAAHLAVIAARVPGAAPVLQLDEPALPVVLAGAVPTPSGFGTVGAIDPIVAEQVLRSVLEVAPAGGRAVHCCAADLPIELLRRAGADAISLDAAVVRTAHLDRLGEAVEAGMSLWLGVLPATDSAVSLDLARDAVNRIWSQLGFSAAQAAAQVVPTPACGMAGATPDYVRRVLSLLRDVGSALLDDA